MEVGEAGQEPQSNLAKRDNSARPPQDDGHDGATPVFQAIYHMPSTIPHLPPQKSDKI